MSFIEALSVNIVEINLTNKVRNNPVPAGHHRVEGDPQLLDGLQDAARHCMLQQQGHAGRQDLHVRDEVLGRQQGQVFQDLHQLGSA